MAFIETVAPSGGGGDLDVQLHTDKIVQVYSSMSWGSGGGLSTIYYYVDDSVDYFDAILILHIESGRNFTGVSVNANAYTNDSVFEILEILETPQYQSTGGTTGWQDSYRNYWKLKVRFTNGTNTYSYHNMLCKLIDIRTTGYGTHTGFSLDITNVVYK